MSTTRRLAAILAADVAGYSRLMGADEEGTLERLKAIRRDLGDPKVKEHHGRIVKTTGDGLLIEFVSVIDAVRCAVEVQQGMAERNAQVPQERRIEFRMGINLGDIIRDGRDIYGDGVNIAARLEALAAPGGICISGTVRDHIGERLPYAFADMGEQSVKNIVRPVRVYALRPEGTAGVATASMSPSPSSPAPAVAPRLSIVVLPFANLSNDPEQQYFADGITEDLTTDLSRLADMLVISRNTAFTYQGKRIDTRQIGRELGVHYVLEGSVRRSGNQIRVNAQLIDAETDAHLWAERFDREIGDLFALQNEVTGRIAIALNFALISAEAARPIANPDALDYVFRGRAVMSKPPSRDSLAEAIGLFERALELDPHSIAAQQWLARSLTNGVLAEGSDSAAIDIARAEELNRQVLAASPSSADAHYNKGYLLRAQGRPEEAIREFEVVLAFDRNSTNALFQLGWCKLMTGAIEEVIPLAEQDIRLSPRDPTIANFYWRIAAVHLLQSRNDDAVLWLEKARSANPNLVGARALLASAYALAGETERGVAELAEVRRLSGDDRYSSLARLKAGGYSGSSGYWGVPKVRALFEATYFAGMRKAGLPEE
jgi:TolB-like protein/Flp pilus assembly protein TadD